MYVGLPLAAGSCPGAHLKCTPINVTVEIVVGQDGGKEIERVEEAETGK